MKTKVISILAALCLVLCVFTSCSSTEGGILKIDGEEVKVQSIVKIGDREISYDLYRHWFLNIKTSMEEANPKIDFTKKENLDSLKSQVIKQLKFICATRDLADKYGITLTDEHNAEIESTMKETFNNAGGADSYKTLLAKSFLTDEVFKEILEIEYLYDYMEQTVVGTDKTKNKVVFTTEEAVTRCCEDFYRLVEIYFLVDTEDEEGNPLSEQQIAKNKKEAEKKINDAYNKVESGKPFLDVLKEHLSGESYELAITAYYRASSFDSVLGPKIEKLKIGEYTEPIYESNTYLMIYRMEPDGEFLKKNGVRPDGYNTISVEDYYAGQLFGEMVEEQMESLKVTELEYYDQITTEALL